MNDKQQLEKLNTLCEYLRKDKVELQQKLHYFMIQIMSKCESLNKINYYESIYLKRSSEPNIIANSALYNNCMEFIKKISKARAAEEGSLNVLEEEKVQLIAKIEELERKIQLFETKMSLVMKSIQVRGENAEANQLDEMSIQRKIREQYE